jgi:putative spermidine/putrescine transport system permease protein
MRASSRNTHTFSTLLESLPVLLLLIFTVIPAFIGVIYGLLCSVGYFPPAGQSGFTLAHYAALWQSGDLWRSLVFTFSIAAVATALSYIIALALALLLRKTSRVDRWSTFALQMPLPFPHIVVAVFTILFWSQSGLISRALISLGVISTQEHFPGFVYDPQGIGIILVFLWKEVPFLTVVMLSVLLQTGTKYDAVAQSLGARGWQRVRYVTMPLVTRGVLPSILLVFTFIIGAFEVPLLIGPLYPPMLSVLTYQRYTTANLELHGEAFAVSTVVSLLMLLLIGIYKRFEKAVSNG